MPDGPRIVFVTPPFLPDNEFPDLGVPQLVGYLAEHGFASTQRDLNAELLFRWLARSPRSDRVFSAGGDRVSGECSPRIADAGLEGVRSWIARCSDAFLLDPHPYHPDAMAEALARPHPVYDAFFDEVFLCAEGASADVVGLSVMSSSQLFPALRLAAGVRARNPTCFIVMGGPWVSAARSTLDRILARFGSVDAMVVDRGEATILAVASTLARGGDLKAVPNLVLRGGSASGCPGPGPQVRLDDIGTPVFEGLDLDLLPLRMLPVQTASRCYWGQCSFCYHDLKSVELDTRSAVRIVNDFERLIRIHGVSSFFLAASATSISMMLEIAEEIGRRGLCVGWSALARADVGYSPDVCKRLRESGCRVLLLGLETVSRRGLTLLQKGITPETVATAVRACGDVGIATYLFLLDYPGNTEEEFRETLQFVCDLAPSVEDFIPSRFQLGEATKVYRRQDMFPLRPTVDPRDWLDPFDIPYESTTLMPQERYRAFVNEYTVKFVAALGRPRRSSPFLLATNGT